jgi:non-ribosomal peptide synthetase component F
VRAGEWRHTFIPGGPDVALSRDGTCLICHERRCVVSGIHSRDTTRPLVGRVAASADDDVRSIGLRWVAAEDRAVYPIAAAPSERTLLDILHRTICEHPQALALDDGRARLSYLGLSAEVAALAGQLAAAGVGVGDRVGVRMRSGTADLYIAILAVLAAGAAYVPSDVDDPDERAQTMWREAGVCAVLSDGPALVLRDDVRPGGQQRPPRPADDAWIIFTSGSTGMPKGVAVTHRSAAALVDAEARVFCRDRPLGPGDRVLAGLSVAFDASCEEMWLAWRHGAALVPAPRAMVRAGAELGDWLVEHRITVVSTVPTLAALWPAGSLTSVRLLILGASGARSSWSVVWTTGSAKSGTPTGRQKPRW